MRLLMLGWMIGAGSTGLYTSQLAGYLVQNGHAVTCLSAGNFDWCIRPRLCVNRWSKTWDLLNSPIVPCSNQADPRNDIASPATERLLRRALRLVNPDVVAIMDFPGWPASTVRVCHEHGARVAVIAHNYWPFCPRLSLFDRWNRICSDYENGDRCVSCMANVVSNRAVRWRLRMPSAIWEVSPLWRGLKFVYHSAADRSPAVTPGSGFAYQARRKAYVRAMTEADLLCCISRRVKELITHFGVRCPRTLIMPVVLEHLATLFEKRTAIQSADVSGRPIRFGYLGAVAAMKGVDTLLSGFKGISANQASLMLYGKAGPDDLAKFKRLVDPRNPAAFSGEYKHADLVGILRHIDVGIVPSACEDTMPNTLMEFQAAGVPVIGARAGGIPERIQHEGNGLLFEPGNPTDLRKAIDRVIASPEVIAAWRASLPSDFSPQVCWRRMEDALRDLGNATP